MSRAGSWLRELVRATRNRDSTAALALVHQALGSFAFARLAGRMAEDPDGRLLLSDRPRVTVGAFDLDRLAALPEPTIGRRWLEHMRSNGFVADVRVPDPPFPESPETAYAKARWRETHDFRHVLTGLGTSIPDETVLAAFQLAQVFSLFSLLVVVFGPICGMFRQNPQRTIARSIEAWRAGRRARLLANIRYEERLDEPVERLRERLGVADLSHLSTRSR